MTKEMYLLMLADNVRTACGWTIAVSVIGGIILTIVWLNIIEKSTYQKMEKAPSFFKLLAVVLPCLIIISILLRIFTPSTDSIIKVYCMTEGSKLINANNIKDVSKELFDKIKEVTGTETKKTNK